MSVADLEYNLNLKAPQAMNIWDLRVQKTRIYNGKSRRRREKFEVFGPLKSGFTVGKRAVGPKKLVQNRVKNQIDPKGGVLCWDYP